MVNEVYSEAMEAVFAAKEELEMIESRSDVEKYEEYSRSESNRAFIEELGRKYAGEVY